MCSSLCERGSFIRLYPQMLGFSLRAVRLTEICFL